MTDKEKIIQEIERRIHFLDGMTNTDFGRGSLDTLNKVLGFINSLPFEQPSERLGDEIDNFRCSDEFALARRAGEEVAATARHFAQWQKEQIMKSAIDAIITSRWKDSHVCLTTNKDIPQIYNGDRVKILIVKEDNQ